MRRIWLVGVTLCVASVMAATLSSVAVSQTGPESEPPTAKGAEDRVLNESPKNPYHQVVDNADAAGFEAKGYQSKASGEGAFGEDYAVATEKAGPASFQFKVPETRYYSVWARWPVGAGAATKAGQPTPADVMRVARTHLGTRYGNATCRAYAQEDCSCFTKLVFQKFGHNFADSPVYQWNMKWGQKFRSKSRLRNGDVVFSDLNKNGVMNPYDHVSIWAGRGNVIHASSYFGKVVISEERYLPNFYGAKRFALR